MKPTCHSSDDASVSSILQIVPRMDRIVFRLHRYYGLPMRDIATIVNRSEESVATKITNTQKTIREFLA